jgi:hypothetical protein
MPILQRRGDVMTLTQARIEFPSFSDDFESGTLTNWTIESGAPGLLDYSAPVGSQPTSLVSYQVNGGRYYAYGGANAVSAMYKDLSIVSLADWMAKRPAYVTLSGYLGGVTTDDDNVVVSAQFIDSFGTEISRVSIGPVLAAHRNNVTGLLFRTRSDRIPSSARTIRLHAAFTRTTGTNLDGYLDNVTLRTGFSTAP